MLARDLAQTASEPDQSSTGSPLADLAEQWFPSEGVRADSWHNAMPMMMGAPLSTREFLTVSEVAELLRVRPRWVYDAAAKGVLPAGRFGKHLRFRRADVEAFTARAFGQRP